LDNPKYIFNELKTRDSLGIKAFWLVKKRKKFFELSNRGIDVIYAYSLKGIWSQLRAGVVVFTHSVNNEYLSYLISHRVKRVQTWHGIPIKKIGYDDENSTPKEIIAIWNRAFPYISDHLDLVLAASEEDSKIYASAFNIGVDKVVITGYPRNDG
jgi:CDP-glycerol glycerophosphotransferase